MPPLPDHSPAWSAHQASADTDLAGFSIPKGAQIMANLHGIHHDDRYWNEPDTYWPERFLEHNRSKAGRTAYIPFGTGMRICPGQHLGRMATWTAATRIVSTFRFQTEADQPLPERETFGLTLTPKPSVLADNPKDGHHRVVTVLEARTEFGQCVRYRRGSDENAPF